MTMKVAFFLIKIMPISEIYNVDCLQYMRSLPDKHFDLCIADPPFGINIHKSGRLKRYNQQWVDDEIPKKEVFDEMFRVSKDVIIWGGNYFLDYLGSTKCFLIYDKKQPQGILNEEYFKVAQRRINDAKSQLSLF